MENIHTLCLFCYAQNQIEEDLYTTKMRPKNKDGRFFYFYDDGLNFKYTYNPFYKKLTILVKETPVCTVNNVDELLNMLGSSYKEIFSYTLPSEIHLSRIDYKCDILMEKEERQSYLKLLGKGYRSYRRLSQDKLYEDSVYFKSKSLHISIYDKEAERIANSDLENLSNYNFLRLEIQLFRPPIRNAKNKHGFIDCIENYFSDQDAIYYLEKYLKPILFEGDYFNLYHAKKMICRNYTLKTAEKLEDFMAYIGRHGMGKTKLKYKRTFYLYKKKLEIIGVNPTPIPKSKRISYLPNLRNLVSKEKVNEEF